MFSIASMRARSSSATPTGGSSSRRPPATGSSASTSMSRSEPRRAASGRAALLQADAREDLLQRYTKTAVVLHWLIAALVIAEFIHGWWMQEIPKQPPGLRADQFNLHKSIG